MMDELTVPGRPADDVPGSRTAFLPQGEEPERVFTEYVRSFVPGFAGPDPETFAALWQALKRALRSELAGRGLWRARPGQLGIVGGPTWNQSALDELTAECYSFVFVTRLPSLMAHLGIKENIDGLIFLNIRHFLHERQRAHDPVGFRVFQILRKAVREGLARGDLHVLGGDPRIGNSTLLASGPAGIPRELDSRSFAAIAQDWTEHLLPDLVTAAGHRQLAVVRQVGHLLQATGLRAWRFGDLLGPLQQEVRSRWQAVACRMAGEPAFEADADSDRQPRLTLVAKPDTTLEEEDAFEKLVAEVDSRVERRRLPGRARLHLRTLWAFLRAEAAGDGEKTGGFPVQARDADSSQRELARNLGIPRNRLPSLFRILGQLVRESQATLTCRTAESQRSRPGRTSGGRKDS